MNHYDILVRTQFTPNPLAIKFIVNAPIKIGGKATFTNKEEAQELKLAEDLFMIQGVEQLHMFENVVTVTYQVDTNRDQLIEQVASILQTRLAVHDPHFILKSEIQQRKKKREKRSPEIERIEEILDRTIRPGLQADGGDIEVIDFKDNVVTVSYQGACGSCPSSMYGTLDAIHSILRAEFHSELDIRIAEF